MHAERFILETDQFGHLKSSITLPANKQFEAIFLVVSDAVQTEQKQRAPHPDIVGKIKILGDIINTASTSSWDLPK